MAAFWAEFPVGRLTDDQAENLAAMLRIGAGKSAQDRTAVRVPDPPRIVASFFPAKTKNPTSPDRAASRDRRRLACSGPMPPALACRFTTGQLEPRIASIAVAL
jgi:hypothetical protein